MVYVAIIRCVKVLRCLSGRVGWLACFALLMSQAGAQAGEAAGSSLPPTQEGAKKMTRILFFGDSICAGSNVPDGKAADAWPALFAAAHRSDCEIVNLSKGGRPTASVAEFQEALAKARACDAVVIALGANDSRDLSKDMVQKACNNIRQMFQLAREAGIPRLILVGPYNINPEKLGASYPIRNERVHNLEQLNQAFQALATEEKVAFVEMYGRIPAQSLTKDGVHPDKAGNQPLLKAFEAFWATSCN